jgi:hypothetical protein
MPFRGAGALFPFSQPIIPILFLCRRRKFPEGDAVPVESQHEVLSMENPAAGAAGQKVN